MATHPEGSKRSWYGSTSLRSISQQRRGVPQPYSFFMRTDVAFFGESGFWVSHLELKTSLRVRAEKSAAGRKTPAQDFALGAYSSTASRHHSLPDSQSPLAKTILFAEPVDDLVEEFLGWRSVVPVGQRAWAMAEEMTLVPTILLLPFD